MIFISQEPDSKAQNSVVMINVNVALRHSMFIILEPMIHATTHMNDKSWSDGN